MKLVRQTAPYIRKKVTVERMMLDVIIALLPSVIFATVYSNGAALAILAMSLATVLASEYIYTKITKRELTKATLYAGAITAIIFALTLPTTLVTSGEPVIGLYVVFVGAAFAIIVGKLVFGGLGTNIGNPAAIGRVVVILAFGSVLTYDAASGATALGTLKSTSENFVEQFNNAMEYYSFKDLFFGTIPGSMGEVSALAIIIGAVYLFYRKAADLRSTLSMLASFSIIILVAALGLGVNPFEYLLFHLLSGGILFGAVFMITDPVTSPTTARGRIIFGMIAGVLTALIRIFGAYPEGVAFAILMANMFVPSIDYYKWQNTKYTRKFVIGVTTTMAVLSLIVFLGIGGIA